MTNVVSNTTLAKQSVVNQSNRRMQVMENITVLDPTGWCWPWQHGDIDMSNISKTDMSVAFDLKNLDTKDVTAKVVAQLESEMNALADSTSKGTASAVGQNQEVMQRFKMSDTTVRNIESSITNTVNSYVQQDDTGVQAIKGLTLHRPCVGNVKLSNEYVSEMAMKDISQNITEAVMNSDDSSALKAIVAATSKSTASDTLVEMVDSVSKMLGGVAAGYFMVIIVIIGALVLILRSFTGILTFSSPPDGGGAPSKTSAPLPPSASSLSLSKLKMPSGGMSGMLKLKGL